MTKSRINGDRRKRQIKALRDFQEQAAKSAQKADRSALIIWDRQSCGGAEGGAGRGTGKGSGKGGQAAFQFPENALHQTSDHEAICVGWNTGSCKFENRRYAHVSFCEGPGHIGANHKPL